MAEQKIYKDGDFFYRELGSVTKEDFAPHSPDIHVGYFDGDRLVIGDCFLVTETSVMFNPLREWEWYEVELSKMVKLQEYQKPPRLDESIEASIQRQLRFEFERGWNECIEAMREEINKGHGESLFVLLQDGHFSFPSLSYERAGHDRKPE